MLISKAALQAFLAHLLLGVLAKYFPESIAVYYFAFTAYAVARIIQASDRNMEAARYALYAASFEIVYRIAGVTVVYEFGKYACMLLLSVGLLVRAKRARINPFFVYLLLLLPAVSLTDFGDSWTEFRNRVMFSLSGPLTLALSGMYFFRGELTEHQYWRICRWGVLPALSLLTVLFLGPSIDSVELIAESNFELSGGFGPNQVSTALGFFAIVFVLAAWNGQVLTLSKGVDYVLIALLLFRALLTFSRGGVFAFVFALVGSAVAMLILSSAFRKRVTKHAGHLVAFLALGACIFIWTNQLTDNWLLNRYHGVSTYEVNTGIEKANHSYLSGRERIADEALSTGKLGRYVILLFESSRFLLAQFNRSSLTANAQENKREHSRSTSPSGDHHPARPAPRWSCQISLTPVRTLTADAKKKEDECAWIT